MGCSGRTWPNANGVYRSGVHERGPPFGWSFNVQTSGPFFTEPLDILNELIPIVWNPVVRPGFDQRIIWHPRDLGVPTLGCQLSQTRLDRLTWRWELLILYQETHFIQFDAARLGGHHPSFLYVLGEQFHDEDWEWGIPGLVVIRPTIYEDFPPDFCTEEVSDWMQYD